MPVTYRHFLNKSEFLYLSHKYTAKFLCFAGFYFMFFNIPSMTWGVDLLALRQNLLTIKPKQLFAQKGYSTLNPIVPPISLLFPCYAF